MGDWGRKPTRSINKKPPKPDGRQEKKIEKSNNQ